MTYQKLTVQWNEKESAAYFVNFIKAGFDKLNQVYWLKAFGGTYKFNPVNGEVRLFDGVEDRAVPGVEWSVTA